MPVQWTKERVGEQGLADINARPPNEGERTKGMARWHRGKGKKREKKWRFFEKKKIAEKERR